MNFTVHIQDENGLRDVVVPAGTRLIDAIGTIDAPCGGNGTCGKCRVIASGALSAPDEAERALLGGDIARGIRLACIARVEGEASASVVARGRADIEMAAAASGFAFSPVARAVKLTLSAPTLEDPLPADRNISAALAASGICGAAVSPKAAAEAAALIRAGTLDAYALLYGEKIVLRVTADEPRVLGAAVDIGTTTVAVSLVDLSDGAKLAEEGFENPQRRAGADVISRIEYAARHGAAALADMIIPAVCDAIARLCVKAGASADDVAAVAVAGNTVMEHLFAGLDPASIAAAPFPAVTLFGSDSTARSLGMTALRPDTPVFLAPCVASYVGGDITSGAAAAGLRGAEGTILYIDIGTNGEMGLLRGGRFTFAATAAGPAFEGAHIAQGMSALDGAVRAVRATPDGFELTTVAGAPPRGLCGSGIIDATAALLDAGLLDETGVLADADEAPPAYADFADEDGERVWLDRSHTVYLCGKDIREVQLAKSAVSAGIATLLDNAGAAVGDIDRVVLAGGFGSNINSASACRIGLIPPELSGRVTAVGNTAAAGMIAWLLSADARADIAGIAAESDYLELSGSPVFMEEFVDRMTF